MFVYNLKINGSKTFKYIFISIVLVILIIVAAAIIRIFIGASNASQNSPCSPMNGVSQISAKNYTNILKAVHDNIDNYVGLKIKFTGYVYRVPDLNKNQFILSRNMIISSDYKYVVVGFLSEYDKALDFKDGSWVEVTGEIYKGNYHGDMPILKITEIKNTNCPNEEYVYPPDESYIPTESII